MKNLVKRYFERRFKNSLNGWDFTFTSLDKVDWNEIREFYLK